MPVPTSPFVERMIVGQQPCVGLNDVIILDQLDPSTTFEKARHFPDVSGPPIAADAWCHQARVDEVVAASFDCGRESVVEVTPV